ncbi:hypothetical protein HZC35_07815 [Candidatus Saganbacteria bacterium]|nr:hypothetical protein [Candidatus Saganbacteria bacterium]
MRKGSLVILLISLSIAVGLTLGCGKQNTTAETPHGTTSYIGTQTPGDVWSWTLGEGTLVGTNETRGYYYKGTFTTLASGFLKAVLTASNDPDAATDGTGKFHLLEFPNALLLVNPYHTHRVIACAARATVAPTAGQYNWVQVPWPGWTSGNKAYGTAEVAESGGVYTITKYKYDINGNSLGITVEAGFSFADGKLTKTGNDLQVFMTPAGLFFADHGPGAGGAVGAKYEAVDLTDVAKQSYRGVLFSYQADSGLIDIDGIGAGPHPSDAAALQGWVYESVDDNLISSDYAKVTFGSPDASGVISGTMTVPGRATRIFRMVIAQISGKYVIAGIGSPSASKAENYFLIQQ